MVDCVLIQCVSLVCRSLSAFLLSASVSVWSMASIGMSLVVCWFLGIDVLLECRSMWGILCSSICLCSEALVWVCLLVLPILVCILFWLASLFLSDGFLL